MKMYQQLTLEQIYQIYALLKGGYPRTEIARIIRRHKSTINENTNGLLSSILPFPKKTGWGNITDSPYQKYKHN